MALNPGNMSATSGMAREIYQVLDATLRPPLEDDLSTEAIKEMQDSWKELSFAIALGVIRHLRRDPAHQSEYAQVFSSASQDAPYWDWLADFAGVFQSWAASGGSVVQLRDAISAFGNANETPTSLQGVLK